MGCICSVEMRDFAVPRLVCDQDMAPDQKKLFHLLTFNFLFT